MHKICVDPVAQLREALLVEGYLESRGCERALKAFRECVQPCLFLSSNQPQVPLDTNSHPWQELLVQSCPGLYLVVKLFLSNISVWMRS